MADANVIEFEKSRGTIESGPNIDQLEPYLDVPGGDEPTSVPVHYLVLAASGVVAYLLAALMTPSGSLAGGAVLAMGFATFALMASRAHARTDLVSDRTHLPVPIGHVSFPEVPRLPTVEPHSTPTFMECDGTARLTRTVLLSTVSSPQELLQGTGTGHLLGIIRICVTQTDS